MFGKLFLGRVVIGLVSPLVSFSQAQVSQNTLERTADVVFGSSVAAQGPGYAIGIIRDGKLVLAKAYGYADIERAIPIGLDTAFNLASLSKQFTAAAVALEIEKTRLGLGDYLVGHWPELPQFMHGITVAHLVYMTSGLPEYYTLDSPKGGWASEDRFTVDDAIETVFNAKKLAYEPGTHWSYSNINFQLLAVLVGRINDRSFSKHMESAIFGRLKMTHSWVDAPIDLSRPYRASAYVWEESTSVWRKAPRLSPHYGGSGVFASLKDLVKWDSALYRDHSFGPRFGELMLSTQRFQHDKSNDAFGLVHGVYRGTRTIWYEGGDYGVSTYMVRLPDRNETVICLANFEHGNCASKVRDVMDVLIDKVDN